MAHRDEADTQKPRPPRFGREVARPRSDHAREAAEKAAALLNDIDTLIPGNTSASS